MSIESAIRTPLKTSLSSIAANVYNGIPETMTSPSICLIPDSPYLETVLINGATTKVKVNLTVTGVVTYANINTLLPIYKSAPITQTKEKSDDHYHNWQRHHFHD
jgi:hypothetical protein